nr:MAG: Protein of unknown function (DUF3199) [Bacteriophage sp.]
MQYWHKERYGDLMIIAVDEVMKLPEFFGQTESVIADKLNAAELMIRAYTNNNFQNRFVRFRAESRGNRIIGTSDYLKVNDTVQISQSCVNDGLYTITEIGDDFIRVNGDLYHHPDNLVTKVEYPADVKAGVLEMLKWDVKNRPKTGIKSETLSRHSVTYFDQDANNQVMGYPVTLLGFLKPYIKARF